MGTALGAVQSDRSVEPPGNGAIWSIAREAQRAAFYKQVDLSGPESSDQRLRLCSTVPVAVRVSLFL
jgi:hypothetical protein